MIAVGRKAVVALAFGAIAVSGCAGQMPGGSSTLARENRDLRAMLKQTMRELRQVEEEQERLRANVETLEYQQRAIAQRAGISPGDPVFASAPEGAPAQRYGSAAPSFGLERLEDPGAAASRAAGPFPSASADASSAPDPLAEDPESRRVRGRVVGPPRTEPGIASEGEDAQAALATSEPGARTYARPVARPEPRTAPRPTASTQEVYRGSGELEYPDVPVTMRLTSYGQAAKQMRDGEYEAAVQNFRDFIHNNSDSPYADDAQYWVGESYLRKGAYSKAIIEFNQVVVHYRSGDNSAKALLKQAEVFALLGDEVDARLSLQKVVNNYPGTPEAQQAARMLAGQGGTSAAGR